jgi:integrase
MAKITFTPIGNSDNVNIYLRLSVERGKQFRRKTRFTINPKDWSTTNLPKPTSPDLKNLKTKLVDLGNDIEKRCNSAISNGIEITGEWLQEQINLYNGIKKNTDPDRLVNHFQSYIDYLPYKRQSNKNTSVSEGTIKKYKTIKNKVLAFEQHTKKQVFIKDVNLTFRKEFITYLKSVERLSDNTVGRYLKFVKTVCNDAKIYGIETNPQLEAFKGFTDEAAKIHFTFDELEKIERANIVSDGLENARDWLIVGCYIGQRVSDLLVLTIANIVFKNGIELIELQQKKTGKQVIIPIHPKVKQILDKRNGEFPRSISAQKFNLHIKKVAEIAEIDEMTEGAIMQEIEINGKKAHRKIEGTFPKHELVTSHICRRSFASNYYGEMPTPLIIVITGHSTESQFLEYVGKPPIDHAQQIAEYLNLIYQREQKKPHLVLRKAN